MPYCFWGSSVKFLGHTAKKNCQFWHELSVSGLYLKFEFTNGYEMMHKAWSGIEEVPYCFARSSVKFQVRTALKIVEFIPDWAFPDCNSSLNSPMATKWGQHITNFDPNWAFLDCKSSLNSFIYLLFINLFFAGLNICWTASVKLNATGLKIFIYSFI